MVIAYFYFKKWYGVFYLGYQQMGKEQRQKWCMGCFIWDTSKWNLKLHEKWHMNVFFCKINKWKRNNVKNAMSVLCGTSTNGTKKIQNYCTGIFLKHQQMKKNIIKHIVHVFCIR